MEDGEISDEDETLRNERNEPKPVCRFYSKGQCTWGASCRYASRGVNLNFNLELTCLLIISSLFLIFYLFCIIDIFVL